MSLSDCHNVHDVRRLTQRRLPGPILKGIDGGADDEVTLRAHSSAFDTVDLVPCVRTGAKNMQMSGTVTVERALGLMRARTERDMKLMGVTRVDQRNRANLRFNETPEAPQLRLAAL